MKKTLVLLLLCFIANFKLFAQDDIVITGKKIASGTPTPDQITKAIQSKFPNAHTVKYYQVPTSGVKDGWAVSEEYNLTPDETVDYYSVSFYQNDAKYYGLFDKYGNVKMYKYKRSEATLPDAVRTALRDLAKGDYKTWKLDSSTYFKTEKGDGTGKEYYEVTAKKGSVKKKVYVAPDGKIISIK